MNEQLINTLAEIVRSAAPLLIAAQGELITERAGVVNLSLDGTILLAAMAAFAIAIETDSTEAGVLVAMLVGMLVALIIIVANITLKINQVALGFVLTLLCADLSTFLGRDYSGLPGADVEIGSWAIPVLKDIPIIGEIFFQQNIIVYFSFILVIGVWFWIYRTSAGLSLRALGERPAAAYVRGTNVQRSRLLYVALGGALVGLAGAGYSLNVKLGWSENATAGQGWIALAIVIFGLWRPYRILIGAYLIVGLRSLALYLQRQDQLNLSIHIINMTPWLLMLLTLMFVASGIAETILVFVPARWRPAAQRLLRSDPPQALGTAFERQ
jgi:general nucleoside transport system permease protein